MKFINIDPKIDSNIDKIKDFCNNIENNESIYEFVENKRKNQKTKDKNNIDEIVVSLIGEKINNLGMIKGTKDNKLIEIKFASLKDGNNENNRKFIDYITEYSFYDLGAETVVLFCKQKDKYLETIGYESLGDYNNYITYVKDFEKGPITGRKKL